MGDTTRRVTDIRAPRHGSRRRDIHLDGDFWRATTTGVLRELGISVGDTIDAEEVERRTRELETAEARERALRLLGYRDRSARALADRLRDDGYPDEVADATVGDLVASGLVDDSRYADYLARTLVQTRGLGRARARLELSSRGVPQVLAEAALDECAPQDAERQRAGQIAQALRRRSDTPERLAGRLVRRGFSASDAMLAARETLETSRELPDQL